MGVNCWLRVVYFEGVTFGLDVGDLLMNHELLLINYTRNLLLSKCLLGNYVCDLHRGNKFGFTSMSEKHQKDFS